MNGTNYNTTNIRITEGWQQFLYVINALTMIEQINEAEMNEFAAKLYRLTVYDKRTANKMTK